MGRYFEILGALLLTQLLVGFVAGPLPLLAYDCLSVPLALFLITFVD